MAKGISVSGDRLVNKTADGVDLNEIFAEVAQVLELWNKERKSITDLLCFRTTDVASAIPQSFSSETMEEATELGQPRAIRPPTDYLRLGYNFKSWDIALRSSWKFLRDATAEQVRAGVTLVLEADNKKTTGKVMERLFYPTIYVNDWGTNCYGLYSADMQPPPHMGKIFDSAHTHYLSTASTYLDSTHVEALLNHVTEHGYKRPGSTMLILLNDVDFDASRISSWRANTEYRPGGPLPRYDFIPSALMPAWISDETIHGRVPNDSFHNLDVYGAYSDALVVKSLYIPAGYAMAIATGGPNSDLNAVGFREHVDPDYQGLLHIPGNGPFPIQDSFFSRSFGVGVRHRGAAVIAQISAGSSYTAPTAGTIPT